MPINPLDTTDYRKLNLQLESLYINAGVYVESLLEQFISGDFIGVKHTLSTEFYNNLSISISEEKCERFSYYEHIRRLINRSLETIEQTVLLEAKLQDEINSIKNDLRAARNPAKPIFELEQEIGTVATIRPEYMKYIQLFGLPKGGVFDTDKLAAVIKSLE